MKLQWSIQSSHTQLVLSQVVYLNYRNEYIWPPTKLEYKRLKFFIWLFTIYIIWSFWINTTHFEQYISSLRLMSEIFDISIWWTSLWLFGHYTFLYKSLSLFPSRILVCAMAFATQYLFSFWHLHLLSSLSKKKIKEWEDRHKTIDKSFMTSLKIDLQ